MSWIKKLQPVTLYQQSDIPYVINENGLLLCYNNFYSNKPIDLFEQYNIEFKINPRETKSYSANYLVLKDFPKVISFSDILNFKETEIPQKNDDIKKICIIKNSNEVLNYDLENYDASFIVSKESCNIQNLPDNTHLIQANSWSRICIYIIDTLVNKKDVYWIKHVPFLEIDFCHFKSYNSLEKITKFFQLIQVETDIQWII